MAAFFRRPAENSVHKRDGQRDFGMDGQVALNLLLPEWSHEVQHTQDLPIV